MKIRCWLILAFFAVGCQQQEAKVVEVKKSALTLAKSFLGTKDKILHSLEVELPFSSKKVYRVAYWDASEKEVHKVELDSSGNNVPWDILVADEKAARGFKYGKLSKRLSEKHQKNLSSQELVELTVLGSGPMSAPVKGADRSVHAALLKASASLNNSSLAAYLTTLGGMVTRVSPYVSAVRVTIPISKLQALSFNPLVRYADLYEEPKNVQMPSIETSAELGLPQTFYPYYYWGTNVKIGIIGEHRSPGCMATLFTGNPYFSLLSGFVEQDSPRTCTTDAECSRACFDEEGHRCHGGVCTAWHGTGVAGMLSFYDYLNAPDAAGAFAGKIYWTMTYDMDSAYSWLLNNGVHVANGSFYYGGWELPYYTDAYSIAGVTTTRPAGNLTSEIVLGQQEFNSICVGGYLELCSDNYPVPCTVQDAWSSYLNPTTCAGPYTGCDRELPHLVSAMNPLTAFTGPTEPDFSAWAAGTSVSAPAIAGLVALMQERWPDTFLNWPEAVRAALMASAKWDVTTPVSGKTFSDYHAPDEKDGAGAPWAPRVASMMSNNRVQTFKFYPSSFTSNKIIVATPTVPAGKTIRVVVSWDGCPVTSGGDGGATVDFDLYLKDSNGNLLENGSSYSGTYEIVEHTVTSAQTLTIQLEHFAWLECPEMGGVNKYVYAAVAFDIRN